MSTKKQLIINPVFEPLFQDDLQAKRYYQLFGGRGSGKSFVASIAMVQLTYSPYKHKILYLRQSMASAEDSTISDIRAAIEFLGKQADFREKAGLLTNIRTGSTITFKGIKSTGSSTAKLKSLSGITTLVFEEAEEVESFEEFSKVDESIRIAGKPLKVILIYNPTSSVKSWIHTEWFEQGQPDVDRFHDTVFMHSTFEDNIDNLAPSVLQRYRDLANTNPTYYQNTILANWTLEVENRIYEGWGEMPFMESIGDVWYGLDFGYGGGDNTSLIKINYFDDVYYIEEIFSRNDLTISSTIQLMIRHKIPFTSRIYADSAVPTLIEEVRIRGYTGIRKAVKGRVTEGLKKMQDKDIVMVGDNIKRTDLYNGYMTFREKPNGSLPHEPDSLAATRYGILSKKPNKGASQEGGRGIAVRKVRRISKERGDYI